MSDSSRRAIRTAFQLALSLSVLLVAIADDVAASFPSAAPYIIAASGFSAGLSRVMTLPAVEMFLERWVPWLASQDKPE